MKLLLVNHQLQRNIRTFTVGSKDITSRFTPDTGQRDNFMILQD